MKLEKKDALQYLEFVFIFLILSNSGFAKYLFFTFWLVVSLIKFRIFPSKKELFVVLPSIICVFIGVSMCIFNKRIDWQVFKEIIFYVLPPIGSVIIWFTHKNYNKKMIDLLFYAIVTVFLLTSIKHYTYENLLESQYAFIFGVFVLYYFYKKDKKLSVLAIFVLVLSHKRIAIVGVLVAILVYLIIQRKTKHNHKYCLKKNTRIVYIVGIITIITMYFWIYLVSNGIINSIFRKNNINSQGRIEQWTEFCKYFDHSIWRLGTGLGYVTIILYKWNIRSFLNLHNDVLQLYVELGFWGFMIYFFSYFIMTNYYTKNHIRKNNTVYILITLIIYSFVCYLTDNISIYITYLFPFYIIILDLIFDKEYKRSSQLK